MNLQYDKTQDRLTIELANKTEIVLSQASNILAQAIEAGVPLPATGKPTKPGMIWHEVESAMLKRIGFTETCEGILEVEYNSGEVYRYYDVPQEVFEKLHKAESKGKFMHNMILHVYTYERVS